MMDALRLESGRRVSASLLLALLLGGCAIDVDLSSAPKSAHVGQTVTFDVAVRNRSSCPVGGVVALLVPFIPKDYFINQIQDPQIRQQLSALVDAFCSGREVTIPDGGGTCRIENGELICEIVPAMTLPGRLPETAFAVTGSGDSVACRSDGVRISCRFPPALLAQAQTMAATATSQPSLGALQCASGPTFAVCAAALLDPNETKTAQVQLAVPRPGVLRNWIVSAPTVAGGVCTGGVLARRPCGDDSDCPGMGNTCGAGICGGGTRDGFGCNVDSDCGGGSCAACAIPDDNQVLAGVACTTTASSATAAPALSPEALLAVVAVLGALGLAAIGRLRRR